MINRTLFLLPLFALFSCSGDPEQRDTDAHADENPTIYAVNYPLAYFAETIGGADSSVTVVFPKIEGDPAYWEPSDADVAAFQNATVILRNGATYAKWAEKVSLPELTQRDTSKAFSGDYIKVIEATTHTHGSGEAHAHAGTAFTTWLDFQQAIWQAEEVRDVLIELNPDNEAGITERFNILADELDALHSQLGEAGRKLADRPLLGSHPIYQYLARRYKLNLREVHWEPDVVPAAEGMAELQSKLTDHPATVMIWEDTPLSESIEKLKEIGIESVVFNPAGNRPGTGDFMSMMRDNVAALESLAQE